MIFSIQFLRLLAASLVVLVHVMDDFGMQSFGGFGVDIFFVISGFIMSSVTHSKSSVNNFLLKRLLRIIPLYWLVTIVLYLIVYIRPELLRTTTSDIMLLINSLLFIPYWTEGKEYFPLLGLGWTLNFEMFFYLLFFVSMRINHKYREIICTILLLLTFILIPNSTSLESNYYFYHYYSNDIILEFSLGMLLAVIIRQFKISHSSVNNLLVLSLVALLFLWFYFEAYHDVYQLPRFVRYGIPAFLLVCCFLYFEFVFVNARKKVKYLITLGGDLSYPLYLVHIFIIAIFTRLLPMDSFSVISVFIISMFFSLLVSFYLNNLFDKPVREYFIRFMRQ